MQTFFRNKPEFPSFLPPPALDFHYNSARFLQDLLLIHYLCIQTRQQYELHLSQMR